MLLNKKKKRKSKNYRILQNSISQWKYDVMGDDDCRFLISFAPTVYNFVQFKRELYWRSRFVAETLAENFERSLQFLFLLLPLSGRPLCSLEGFKTLWSIWNFNEFLSDQSWAATRERDIGILRETINTGRLCAIESLEAKFIEDSLPFMNHLSKWRGKETGMILSILCTR